MSYSRTATQLYLPAGIFLCLAIIAITSAHAKPTLKPPTLPQSHDWLYSEPFELYSRSTTCPVMVSQNGLLVVNEICPISEKNEIWKASKFKICNNTLKGLCVVDTEDSSKEHEVHFDKMHGIVIRHDDILDSRPQIAPKVQVHHIQRKTEEMEINATEKFVLGHVASLQDDCAYQDLYLQESSYVVNDIDSVNYSKLNSMCMKFEAASTFCISRVGGAEC